MFGKLPVRHCCQGGERGKILFAAIHIKKPPHEVAAENTQAHWRETAQTTLRSFTRHQNKHALAATKRYCFHMQISSGIERTLPGVFFRRPEYRPVSAYTEFEPPFAGAFKEYGHGQDNEKQQGSEETGSSDAEGKEVGQAGEEARLRCRSADSPLNARSSSSLSKRCLAVRFAR